MGSERSKSALNCHGQPNHSPPMISKSSNIWTVRDHDVFASALNRVALGDIYQAQGQFRKAEQIYKEGISVFRQMQRVHALAITLRNLALVQPSRVLLSFIGTKPGR